MAIDITGLGAVADSATKILGMFFPDKTQQERDQLAASLALLNAQTTIDNTEAASTDPLQHWRGGLGWVCAMAYFYNFVFQPLLMDVSTVLGHAIILHPLDIGPLATLTAGMLGLGAIHATERIKGAA